ncbi:Outer membrane protein TolC [Daejeonella rubra]|uniref:Outer membrane protein TolC n=1 Tax=Daejeonella rubra TaxID=990371 RepID=A0A1G9VTP6_9SPHI|nr:TolC family protein [Daejeonella rubra]SDM75396.1 Outer membrane protein TolC [Daejeonella rubra]
MNRKNFKRYIFLILLLAGNLQAQERLSLEQAVQLALENNYDIKLNKNDVEQAKNNVSRANAGMLPVVTGNFSTNNTVSNTKQTLSSGQTQERTGAKNSNLVYGPVLNWQVFDGFEMFARYDRLKELEQLGEANFKLTVQNTLADVINNYYDLVSQQQQIKALSGALDISRLRLKNSNNRFKIGKAAKLEVLAATVDLNTDTTNLLRQIDVYRSTKIRLNELLAREISTEFKVSDSIIIGNNLILAELQASASQLNPNLQSALINRRIAEINLKEVKANRYPDININSGYNFSKSTSELGFARTSTGRGLNYGLSASINIFNGYLQKRNEKNASLQIENSKLQYDKITQNISSQLASLYQTYQTNLELVRLEQENLGVAKQNMDITLEKFRIGSVAPLEFREAQRNYIDANARFTSSQFDAKLAEIALLQLSGKLNLQ